ncbi:ABC transporter ATP-binding protein [Mammaliicoccus sp. Dog046]|uniref:ABC transporter ATP-binding protein n=1 Tax=Mammaliicoccus sp. Dog046 TaxID=3034233 RepID=UPI002B259BE1|nr:ABC transporter ATP-binding protein [Mammaliicoccus sp. Dog046]WQK85251.1 ABC transporter ATP-binding protein [Mammaliicoccus sp. Dog046]
MIASVKNVNKRIDGRVIIDDISFTLKKGHIHVILGPNGVGKTSTIRLLTGLLKSDSGSIEMFGYNVNDPRFNKVRAKIGVQNDGNLYENLSIKENLVLWANFYKIPKKMVHSRIETLLNEFGLYDRLDSKVASLSKGMKQKVALVRAVLHEPELLILDEPTSGLDPEAAESLIQFLKKLVDEQGVTIFMCTHHLDGLENIADDILIMNKGKFIVSGDADGLLKEAWPHYEFEIKTNDANQAYECLKSLDNIRDCHLKDDNKVWLSIDDYQQISLIIETLIKSGIQIYTVNEHKHSIKELYFNKIGMVNVNGQK